MTQDEFLISILKGNSHAAQLCSSLGYISQVWDDLIDGDKTIGPTDITGAFWEALIVVPMNPFYRQHETSLRPMLQLIIMDWINANQLERSRNQEHLHISFVQRDRLGSLVTQCALLVGGFQWAQEVGPKITQYFFDETYEQYSKRFET